jgi:hypothetical protein
MQGRLQQRRLGPRVHGQTVQAQPLPRQTPRLLSGVPNADGNHLWQTALHVPLLLLGKSLRLKHSVVCKPTHSASQGQAVSALGGHTSPGCCPCEPRARKQCIGAHARHTRDGCCGTYNWLACGQTGSPPPATGLARRPRLNAHCHEAAIPPRPQQRWLHNRGSHTPLVITCDAGVASRADSSRSDMGA